MSARGLLIALALLAAAGPALSAPAGLAAPATRAPGALFLTAQRYCFPHASRPDELRRLLTDDGWRRGADIKGMPDDVYRELWGRDAGGEHWNLMFAKRSLGGVPVAMCTVGARPETAGDAEGDVARWLGLEPTSPQSNTTFYLVQAKPGGGYVRIADDPAAVRAAMPSGPVFSVAVVRHEEMITLVYGSMQDPGDK